MVNFPLYRNERDKVQYSARKCTPKLINHSMDNDVVTDEEEIESCLQRNVSDIYSALWKEKQRKSIKESRLGKDPEAG